MFCSVDARVNASDDQCQRATNGTSISIGPHKCTQRTPRFAYSIRSLRQREKRKKRKILIISSELCPHERQRVYRYEYIVYIIYSILYFVNAQACKIYSKHNRYADTFLEHRWYLANIYFSTVSCNTFGRYVSHANREAIFALHKMQLYTILLGGFVGTCWTCNAAGFK